MLRVGLTGGIGSGKSTVARIFQVLGIPVYYADDAAKRLMNQDPSVREQIIHSFGSESYENDLLNRHFLSSVVFNDPEKLSMLNAIVHPATIQDSMQWMQEQSAAYAIKEAALIFESGSEKNLDYVIGIYAPEQLRIRRIMERDKVTEDQVHSRMKNQMPEDEKMRLYDFQITNDEKEMVIPQVLAIHHELLELSKAGK